MRTTLTLDRDVATAIERLRRKNNGSLKTIVNEALRYGLLHMTEPPAHREPFVTETVDLGRCRLAIDDVSEALAVAEEETFR